MADNRIRFSIDSVFNGEGFQKAAKATEGISRQVKNAAEGVGKLSGEMSGLGGVVGKAADGIGKLMSGLSAGPVGVAVAGLSLVVAGINSWRESAKKAEEAQDRLLKQLADGYDLRVKSYAEKAHKAAQDALNATIKRGQEAIAAIDALTRSYAGLYAAEMNVANAESRLANAKIDAGVASAGDSGGKDARSLRAAHAALEKAENEYAVRIKAATQDLYKANDAMNGWRMKVDAHRKTIAALEKTTVDSDEVQQKLTAERAALRDAERALAASEKNFAAAKVNEEALTIERSNAIQELTTREKMLKDEIDARAEKERQAAAAAAAEAKEKEARKSAMEAEKAARKKLTDEMNSVTSAHEREIAALDKKITATEEYIETLSQAKQKLNAGMASEMAHGGDYNYTTDANGNVADAEDAERAQRYGKRADREAANAARHMASKQKQWQERRDKLKRDLSKEKDKKAREKLQDKIDDLDDLINGTTDATSAEQQMLNLQQKQKDLMQEMKDKVSEIKSQLEKLGAK